jgi:arylsulfatase A-like enzyme
MTEEERLHLLSQYDGGIAYVDSRLGRLVDRLKQGGLWDDALVVVTSDHGEAFGERGLIDHGVSVYQDQVWVPLVVKYPRGAAPRVVDDAVSTVDVLPTVLDVLGIDAPEDLRGRSLRAGGGPVERAVVAEHYPFEQLVRKDPEAAVARALVAGRWKLVRRDDGREELYDLDTDPEELHDLRGSGAAPAEELDAALDRWLEETPAAESAADALDEDASERLKALGYVQ